MEWLTDETTIGGAIVLALLGIAAKMIWGWAKYWQTEIIACSDMVADHAKKFVRQDEKNENVEKTLERLEKGQIEGFTGVNKRLDDVIGSKRA